MVFLVDAECFQQQTRIQVRLSVHLTGSRHFAARVMAPALPCASLTAFYSPLQGPVLISRLRQWSKVSRIPLAVAVATLDAAAVVVEAGVVVAVAAVAAVAVGNIDEFGIEGYTDSVHIDSAVVDMEVVVTAAVVDNVAAAIDTGAAVVVDIGAVAVQAEIEFVEVAAVVDTVTAAAVVVGIATVVDIAIVADTATVVDTEPVAEADTVTAVEVEGYIVVAAVVGTELAVAVVAVAVAAAVEVVDWQPTLETQKKQWAPLGNGSPGADEADAGSYPAIAAAARKCS